MERRRISLVVILVGVFLGCGAGVMPGDDGRRLQGAIGRGDIGAVEALLRRGADMDARDRSGNTPLLFAIRVGQDDAALLLIDKGADLTIKDDLGYTPLILAARKGRREIARALLESGADVKARTNMERTALHEAAGGGFRDIADPLLQYDADIEAQDSSLRTPLGRAVSHGHRDVTEFFLAKGANVNARQANGMTPLDMAVAAKHNDIANLLRKHGGKSGKDMGSMDKVIEEHRLAKALPKIPKKEIPGEAPPEIRKGIEGLYAREATQRAAAARDLGRMGAQAASAIRFLIAMLHDRTDAKCDFGRTTPGDEAMKALGRIGEPALDPLIKALKDEDGNVQLRSAEALGEIGDARAVDPLIAILKTSKNENVQSCAAKALVRIGKPASAPLKNAIPNLGEPARAHAARALKKIARDGQ